MVWKEGHGSLRICLLGFAVGMRKQRKGRKEHKQKPSLLRLYAPLGSESKSSQPTMHLFPSPAQRSSVDVICSEPKIPKVSWPE